MTRRKKKSAILEKSQERLTGLKTIDGKADLGNGITSATFEKEVSGLRQQIEAYNVLLTKADEAANAIEIAEKQLSITAENVLLAVKVKYGKDSSQYEMAGGTRQSERRRRKPQVAPQSAPQAASQVAPQVAPQAAAV